MRALFVTLIRRVDSPTFRPPYRRHWPTTESIFA